MTEIYPVPLNISREVDTLKKPIPSYDKFKLNSLVFLKHEIDPLNFIEEFDSCFSEKFKDEEKSIHLLKHIPVEDHIKFRSVWTLPIEEQYERIKTLFLDEYTLPYVKHKSAKLSTSYSDYSSVKKFVEDKLDIYKRFDNLTDQQALNKVIFELPPEMCSNLLKKGAAKDKSKLLNLVELIDLRIEVGYDGLFRPNSNSVSKSSSNFLQNFSITENQISISEPSFLYPSIIQLNNDDNSNETQSSAFAFNNHRQNLNNNSSININTKSTAMSVPPKKKRGRPKKILNTEDNAFSAPTKAKKRKLQN